MNNPDYTKKLFNALKNKTRIQILQAIVNGKCSVSKIQLELKKNGYKLCQKNIIEKYVHPLITVGLAAEELNWYYATTFGRRLTELLGGFLELAEKLPAHSECHEETLLIDLLNNSRTFEEISTFISSRSSSRILKRLRSTDLIEFKAERDYVFFVKSKRDIKNESLKTTERKIYDDVTYDGISAGKLAEKTGLSLRGTYRYLRRLRGKKLVFIRRKTRVYSLTMEGRRLASALLGLQRIVEDMWNSSELVRVDATISRGSSLANHSFLHKECQKNNLGINLKSERLPRMEYSEKLKLWIVPKNDQTI